MHETYKYTRKGFGVIYMSDWGTRTVHMYDNSAIAITNNLKVLTFHTPPPPPLGKVV